MGLELRNPNWKSFKTTAPSGGYSAGDMVKVNDTIGVIVEDASAGNDAVLIYSAEKIVVPKATGSGIAFSEGSKVYYDASAKKVTNSASGTTLVGIALESAGASDTTVLIDLDGTPKS